MLLSMLAACVVPYGPLPYEVEPKVNHPPVILQELVIPERTRAPIVADIGAGCGTAKFSATVIDYDGDEEIFYEWRLVAHRPRPLVLWQGSAAASALSIDTVLPQESADLPGVELPRASEALADARTYPAIELEITSELLSAHVDDLDVLVQPPPAGDVTHLLELFVSDRRFAPGTVTPLPADGEPLQPVANVSWLIDIDDNSEICETQDAVEGT